MFLRVVKAANVVFKAGPQQIFFGQTVCLKNQAGWSSSGKQHKFEGQQLEQRQINGSAWQFMLV